MPGAKRVRSWSAVERPGNAGLDRGAGGRVGVLTVVEPRIVGTWWRQQVGKCQPAANREYEVAPTVSKRFKPG